MSRTAGSLSFVLLFLGLIGSSFAVDLKTLAFEGTCTTPPGHLATDLNLPWITSLPKFFIVYGSLQYWVQNAEACFGREPLTLAVLMNMGLQTDWDLNSTTTCYGRKITQSCELNPNNGNPFAACNVVKSSPGTNPAIFSNFSKRVVLTDNRTFALFVRCTNGNQSYYIASPTPHLSQSAILQSVAKIIQLGFDITLFTKIPPPHPNCD